jgi:hypothetical protein
MSVQGRYWGLGNMFIQHKIAGLLTCFGLAGLVASPFILAPASSAARPASETIAIAITSGSKLHLLRPNELPHTSVSTDTRSKGMVCASVYRLVIADLGVSCKHTKITRSVAAVDWQD